VTLTIGVDIGGTKVVGGVVDPRGRVLARIRRDTPADDVARTRTVIVDVVRELAAGHDVVAAGVGAAGWIDAAATTVGFAPNLAWRDEPLRDTVAAAVDVPVFLENDGNAAAWAEFRFGAGREATDSMVLIAVGTGIGGGIVIDGRLLRGANGTAGELGHAVAVPDGHQCGCGRQGCLEQYASGRALVRYARAGATEHPSAAATLLDLAGGDAQRITGPMVTEAARAGDKVAGDAFQQAGWWLGIALADLVQILDPQLLVVGGGVAEAGELLLTPATESYGIALGQRGRLPVAPVTAARLGNSAGMIGAADMARARLAAANGAA
jgi:glucokinase